MWVSQINPIFPHFNFWPKSEIVKSLLWNPSLNLGFYWLTQYPNIPRSILAHILPGWAWSRYHSVGWVGGKSFWTTWCSIAHCVLLGNKYTLKKKLFVLQRLFFWWILCITRSQWQKIMVFYPYALKEKPKNFFCSAISGLCPLGTNKSTGDQSIGPPLVHQGLAH